MPLIWGRYGRDEHCTVKQVTLDCPPIKSRLMSLYHMNSGGLVHQEGGERDSEVNNFAISGNETPNNMPVQQNRMMSAVIFMKEIMHA